MRTWASPVLLLGCCVGLAGCTRGPAGTPPPATVVVPVSHPITRDVVEYVEYTGRTDAVDSVGIRPRATGYLTKTSFKEGDIVKKGDVLFEIDPRPYQAQLDQAEGQVRVAEAQFTLAQANYNRIKGTGNDRTFSPQEVDQAKAAQDAADAQVKAAKATAEVYRLNLSYTRVTSPIDGQVSRYYYTVGNLVNQDQTLLTTVVSTDPMKVYLDMDERTMLRVRNSINQGKIQPRGPKNELPLLMRLEGEEGFPHKGAIDFSNNTVNPSTGTIAIRGEFANPLPPGGRRLLSPGMFTRLRLPLGGPRPAVLVVDRAIGSDQGLKFVYVVEKDKKISYRRVKVGPLEDDGLRVIEGEYKPKTGSQPAEGLRLDDVVAVGAIQQLRPGMEVETEMIAMPTPGAPSAPPPPDGKPAPTTPPTPAPKAPSGAKN
ncbi:efflux RND transporter periplasmic adaptor subunit [Limnoglobus roseus]|uniref:Efflux RND transporter periplasmic adaptor subunit n=1 Tax=Limnoglobus roseus TaxID=2598579 RepID=A0A5C1AM92_9BACT|nr:efflux RND transporter periplasmic adaptor subunit [Limnoglobus roseus]QEL20351.1 efflux RND transporter periplasmic adaptor subunit [Limnoglobus roseus]